MNQKILLHHLLDMINQYCGMYAMFGRSYVTRYNADASAVSYLAKHGYTKIISGSWPKGKILEFIITEKGKKAMEDHEKIDEQLQQEDFEKFKELRKDHSVYCAINMVLANEKCRCRVRTIDIDKVIKEIIKEADEEQAYEFGSEWDIGYCRGSMKAIQIIKNNIKDEQGKKKTS